jgi:acyl carrier protein
MGLDIVELVWEIEKFLNIKIKDEDAERIYTLSDAVDTVANYLNIEGTYTSLQDELIGKVIQGFNHLGMSNIPISADSLIFTMLKHDDESNWKLLSEHLGLIVPKPLPQTRSWFNKMLTGQPARRYDEITLQEFVDVICMANYRALVDGKNPRDRYDIYVGIAGITARVSGVDFYEINPNKSFTDDLGMD